jgi:hypothetical protein
MGSCPMSGFPSDDDEDSIRAVCKFKAEILVDIRNGSYAEMSAREYLSIHPEALKLITLSCERLKIKRLLKEQGTSWSGRE